MFYKHFIKFKNMLVLHRLFDEHQFNVERKPVGLKLSKQAQTEETILLE